MSDVVQPAAQVGKRSPNRKKMGDARCISYYIPSPNRGLQPTGKYESALAMKIFGHWSFVASIEGIQSDLKEKIEQKPKGPEGLPISGL